LGVLESWRAADRRIAPLAVDTGLAGCITLLAGRGGIAALAAAGGFLMAGIVAGVWRRRSSVETLGIRWFARPAAVASAGAGAALVAAGTSAREAAVVALAVFISGVLIRALAWIVVGAARRQGMGLRPALVVAGEDWAQQLEHRMTVFPEAGLYCAATIDVPRAEDAGWILGKEVERTGCAHVLLADCPADVVRTVGHRSDERLECSVVVPVKGVSTPARLGDIGLVPLSLHPSRGAVAAKRAFDLILSALVLIAVGPLMLGTAIAIAVTDGRPVLYRQKRVGRDGRQFTCFKFRSMVVDAEQRKAELEEGNINVGLLFKLMDDPRITPIGRLIRRFSIDELPQLLNVLRGDMSLVGPRPLPVNPDDFEADAAFRHLIPPGITGLWQVHGCNALSYADMLDLDHTYMVTRSIWLDLGLILRTIPALLVRRSAV
jgi:lipopolysaccharide/colanic/teichoic acid biosynthesis glycosyltransferase